MLISANHSRLILIRVKNKRFGFVIPLPLFILEDLVDSLCDLLYLGEKAMGGTGKFKPGVIIELFRQTLVELARYGRWKMVDIEVDKIRVSIEFY